MNFSAIVKANTYNKNRLLKFLAWFALFYFETMLTILILDVVVFAISENIIELTKSQLSKNTFLQLVIIAKLIIFTFIFYAICNKLFNKGVNVF